MGIDQIAQLFGSDVYIADGFVYGEGEQPGNKNQYSQSDVSDSIFIKDDTLFTVVTPESGQRHSDTFQEDFLTATPNDYGVSATHEWVIADPQYGTPGESGDEVDNIEITYDREGFTGQTDADVTVEMVRTLSGGPDRSNIGVNSGTYEGDTATIELSGFSQTDAAGPISVTIPNMDNPLGPVTATLTLTGDAPDKSFQGLFPEDNPRATPPDIEAVYHVDVGQADSSIVRTTANETVVIDSGTGPLLTMLALDALEVDYIDHLVATHAHTDHIGGHEGIIKEYENNRDGVGRVWDNGVSTGSQTYLDYIDTVDNFGIPLILPRRGDEIGISGATAEILNPKEGNLNEIQHDNCVTVRLTSPGNNKKWLVTGDANLTAEQDMLDDASVELPADIYQVGHHGASNSTKQAFLDAVAPTYAVISAPIDSPFDHPKQETLDKLAAANIETYWTAKHGDIDMDLTEPITIATEQSFSTDPADFAAEKQ